MHTHFFIYVYVDSLSQKARLSLSLLRAFTLQNQHSSQTSTLMRLGMKKPLVGEGKKVQEKGKNTDVPYSYWHLDMEALSLKAWSLTAG